MASLVDTNILVYRVDPRDPQKRALARKVLREGGSGGSLRIPYQALMEFVSSVTRPRGRALPLMTQEAAAREAELLMTEFPVLYPNERVFRTALYGAAMYRMAWYDAHLWAHAEHYGVPELLSEDFEHGRRYGTVWVRNPFLQPRIA